jgi:cytochrome oxidase Cu insertion factor (SCO1/SenC/PrrC family)
MYRWFPSPSNPNATHRKHLFMANFAAIQRALDDKKFKDYWLLSITTDPERDSAAILKEMGIPFTHVLATCRK